MEISWREPATGSFAISHAAALGDAAAAAGASRAADGIELRLLGPLELQVGGQASSIQGYRRQVILLMLLLEHGRVVPATRLIQATWGDNPPRTAETQVQICISQLRSLFAKVTDVEVIHTHAAGYVIRVPGDAVDMLTFRQLVADGRALAQNGDFQTSAFRLRAALDLWRGEAAAEVHSQVVQAAALRLNEERLTVLQEWLAVELELGRHLEHLAELSELVAAYPLREKLHAMYGLALYRAGRQAEALAACRHAREILVEEHGLDPSEELLRLERAILDQDEALDPPEPRPTASAVPRQLPAMPADFVGRDTVVSDLLDHLAPATPSDRAPTRIPIIAISGAAGVGKSALAVYLSYQLLDAYADGQLYARLGGTDSVPAQPAYVLSRFLHDLGAEPESLPDSAEDLAAVFRSWVAQRRILVVLDDAAGEAQVQPLLPANPQCAVVVTSRHSLAGLPVARRISLGVLDHDASLSLICKVIGEERVRAEPEATAALAEACGHLPLAIQIAAAKLAVKAHWRITQMVSRLTDERGRLDQLNLDEVGVRPSLFASYQGLPERAAELLQLLSALGPTDFAGWVAGPLLDLDVLDALDILDQLVDARLVQVENGSGHRTRYRLHDLTRIFGLELLAQHRPAAKRTAAQHRLLRCWLSLAAEAHRREFGGDYAILHAPVPPWPLPPELLDEILADPVQWLQSEHSNLVLAVCLSAQLRLDDLCWDLAVTSVTLFETRAYYQSWRDTHEVAMQAVRTAGNQRGEAVLRYSRGGLALAQKRLSDARQDTEQAMVWFDQAGDIHGRGLALRNLASIDRLQGNSDQALGRYEAALADLDSVGDLIAKATELRRLAQLHLERENTEAAEGLLREALATCLETGVRRIEAQVRYRLGEVLLAKGELGEAEQAFATVLEMTTSLGDLAGQAYAMLGNARVLLARNQVEAAEGVLCRALVAASSGGRPLAEGQIRLELATSRFRCGAAAAAAAELDKAEAIFHKIGSPLWSARVQQLRRHLPEDSAG